MYSLSSGFPSVHQGEQHLPHRALVRTEPASTHGVWQSDWGLMSNQEVLALAIFNPLLQSSPLHKPSLYLKEGLSFIPQSGLVQSFTIASPSVHPTSMGTGRHVSRGIPFKKMFKVLAVVYSWSCS